MSDLTYIKMPESNEPVRMNRACPVDCRGHIPSSALESAACEIVRKLGGPCSHCGLKGGPCGAAKTVIFVFRKHIGGGE